MSLFAIGDLHLSESVDKPMDVFGSLWERHTERIAEQWRHTVGNEDTVLIPGDISWAMSMDEARADLDWIAQLPGHKVMIRGNHDYWWSGIGRVRALLDDTMIAIQNDAIAVAGLSVCGTRGWLLPSHPRFTEHDETIYRREGERLKLALQAAAKLKHPIVAMLHYPPAADEDTPTVFTDLLEAYGVQTCVYGHLHGAAHRFAVEGLHRGVDYKLVSADYLKFQPVQL